MSQRGRVVPFEHPFFRRQHSWNLEDPWSDLASPSRMVDQYFGMGVGGDDEFFRTPSLMRSRRPERMLDRMPERMPERMPSTAAAMAAMEDDFYRGMYLRPRRQESVPDSGMSEVSNTADEFRVNLDVAHFKPEEIQVKTVDNKIVIRAKHEEKEDEHGYIMREFQRSYMLPKDVDPITVKSSLTADGILAIKGPKKSAGGITQERAIPIEHSSSTVPTVTAST